MNNKSHLKEIFYKELNHKSSIAVCRLIKERVLEQMNNEELKQVFPQLMQLRNKEVIELLAKQSHYFPIEMLDMEIRNQNDKDFVSFVLSKYGKKFQYKLPDNANRLFQVACETDCSSMLLFLLGKGLAEGQYPRLASGSDKLLDVLNMVRVKGLDPDTIVTFFVEAAVSGQADKRIPLLEQMGFHILTENSEGMNACEVLRRGIDNYNYGKGKQATIEKQRDLQGLKTLQRYYAKKLESI